ncbi:WhiB family transcriptional regulator [Streptacidiphilus sp. MAP12-33]|uniref:WhiB family transcriptional regulator n=1 Tax=Streptacidiphilus sp. MAP12-33 TaxID=3156266 RepID=UPI0035192A1C
MEGDGEAEPIHVQARPVGRGIRGGADQRLVDGRQAPGLLLQVRRVPGTQDPTVQQGGLQARVGGLRLPTLVIPGHEPARRIELGIGQAGEQPPGLPPDRAVLQRHHAKTASGQQNANTGRCLGCPVRAECLADAPTLPADNDYGVRGGKTRQQRIALRRRPDLPTGRDAVTIAAFRRLPAQEQPDIPRHRAPRTKRRAPKERRRGFSQFGPRCHPGMMRPSSLSR